MTERAVTFARVFNFRDLGGYRTADGRTTQWQRLYRSDDLSRLGDDDRERFASLGIRTVVDLRRPDELDQDGRIPQLHDFDYHHVHLTHPTWPLATFTDTAERASFVLERYREMSIHAADGIGQTLRLIANPDAAPLVFHCLAGKDRTGIVSALTLSLLGVSDDDVADDYQRSELAEPEGWAYLTRGRPDMQDKRWLHITVSPRQGMLDFLADIRERHGSIEEYVATTGVTPAHLTAMRAHLLTP